MEGAAEGTNGGPNYTVEIDIEPTIEERNRLTTAFRFFLAIPHLILVGGPLALLSYGMGDDGLHWQWGSGSGILGAVAGICAVIAWFWIMFTTRHPDGLWNLSVFYLRWRVRAAAYVTLLRDEYPPFGEDDYPAELRVTRPEAPRDRVRVGLRVFLVIPHLFCLWFLTMAWCLTTAIAWVAILITGRLPDGLGDFGAGVLRWSIRVEAYMLLLRDEYPPFSLA